MRLNRSIALAASLAILSACVSGGGGTTVPGQVTVPDGCREVPAATSPEKFTLLTGLAEDVQRHRARSSVASASQSRSIGISSGCRRPHAHRGLADRRLSRTGPGALEPGGQQLGGSRQPTIGRAGAAPIANDFERIMITPLVLGMPRPMAEALGWPEADIGWADILALASDPEGWGSLGHPEWGDFRLGKTNPNFSTSGLSATAAIYYAATGKTSGLTEADLTDPEVVEFVRGVEAATVHYGDTTLTFLDNMYRDDQAGRGLTYVSAIAVEEVSILAYNRGDPADTGTPGPPPRVPLVAVYPSEGTLYSDNPAFVLDAAWVDRCRSPEPPSPSVSS